MGHTEPAVNPHVRANVREEGRVQRTKDEVRIGNEWNAEKKREIISALRGRRLVRNTLFIHFCPVRTLVANDDGVQGWIEANIPCDPVNGRHLQNIRE